MRAISITEIALFFLVKNMFDTYEKPDFEILLKAEIVEGDEDGKRFIQGIASTEHLDKQKEKVIQKGLDFSEFLDTGFFNDNHARSTGAVVGYPTKAEFLPGKGWYVEGELLKGHKPADDIWTLAKSLEKAGSGRHLGLSIEGKTLLKKGNCIVKAKVRHVAITHCPVNPNCTVEMLAKSFCSTPDIEKCVSCDPDCVNLTEIKTKSCNGDCNGSCAKALAAGYGNVAGVDQVDGAALRQESLETGSKKTTYTGDENDKKKKKRGGEGGEITNLTRSEAEDFIRAKLNITDGGVIARILKQVEENRKGVAA